MQQAALSRRERQFLEVRLFCCFVVCLRKSVGLAGDLLGFLVCRLIEYSHVNIFPQITQITQTNAARAALYRRERQVGEVNVVLGFWVSSA